MKALMIAAVAIGTTLPTAFTLARLQDQPQGAGSARQDSGQARQAPESTPEIPNLEAKASYGFGLNLGRRLKQQADQLGLDSRHVAQGIVDGLTDAEPQLSDEELQQVMQAFEAQLLERQVEAEKAQMEQRRQQGEAQKQAGTAFRAEFKTKPEVQETESGLLYEELASGDGEASPTAEDTVTIHYTGQLIDNTVFDSTEGREPLTLPVNQFIEGWKDVLQRMKVGDKWRVVLPPELAYGEEGTPNGPIPPNATLIFEIELLEIE